MSLKYDNLTPSIVTFKIHTTMLFPCKWTDTWNILIDLIFHVAVELSILELSLIDT